MSRWKKITFDPKVMQGQACIRGMRITASLVISFVAHGKSAAEICREYPDLEADDIQEALEYASWLASEKTLRQLPIA